MSRDSDLLLTAEELRLKRRKRRRWLLFIILFLLLIPAVYFVARPARDAIKAWQARRHAQRAFAFIDKEQWNDARSEAVAAFQLRKDEPQSVRAVARFLTRTRQPDSGAVPAIARSPPRFTSTPTPSRAWICCAATSAAHALAVAPRSS